MLATLLTACLVAAPSAGPISSVADANWCMGFAAARNNQVGVQACSKGGQNWTRHGYELRINGRCLDNAGGRTQDGNPLLLWDCHGGPNQRWILQNKHIMLLGGGLCAAAAEDPRTNAGLLVLSSCSDATAQEWSWAGRLGRQAPCYQGPRAGCTAPAPMHRAS